MPGDFHKTLQRGLPYVVILDITAGNLTRCTIEKHSFFIRKFVYKSP
jgi:hypothetical protein